MFSIVAFDNNKNYYGLSFMFECFLFFSNIFNVFINREACGVLSLHCGFYKEVGVGVKSTVVGVQDGCNRENSVGVLSGGLTNGT